MGVGAGGLFPVNFQRLQTAHPTSSEQQLKNMYQKSEKDMHQKSMVFKWFSVKANEHSIAASFKNKTKAVARVQVQTFQYPEPLHPEPRGLIPSMNTTDQARVKFLIRLPLLKCFVGKSKINPFMEPQAQRV